MLILNILSKLPKTQRYIFTHLFNIIKNKIGLNDCAKPHLWTIYYLCAL